MAVIIFKPTEKCNSNCIYCDVVKQKDQSKVMSFELLELVMGRVNRFLEAKPEETIIFTWHGGEPLLLGVDYFRKAVEYQRDLCRNTQHRIKHLIQSNLTLMNTEYIDVFRQMGIDSIGTSYEPLPGIRGPGEKHDSELYNRLFRKGIKILEENGLNWGFIYVVTQRALEKPLDIFYYLTNMGIKSSIMLNPVQIYGEDIHNLAITPAEFAEFLGKIFPEWWKNRSRYPVIEPFSSFVTNIVEKKSKLFCVDSGQCATNHIYVGPDGELSQCGRAGDWSILDYGNIRDKTLEEVFDGDQKTYLMNRQKIIRENDCKDCRFWNICNGGCPLDAIIKYGDLNHKSEWCETKKIFLEQYFEPITGCKYN
jgi:uncharacterized protein